jgi:hypothetical protein
MADTVDDLDKLLMDVRKTISENKLFLEKLVDETVEDEEETENIAVEDAYEEL